MERVACICAFLLTLLSAGLADEECASKPCKLFIRGDAYQDGVVDETDVWAIYTAWQTGYPPEEDDGDRYDWDDNGVINSYDFYYAYYWVYFGISPPAAPYPESGFDPTDNDPWRPDCVPAWQQEFLRSAIWSDLQGHGNCEAWDTTTNNYGEPTQNGWMALWQVAEIGCEAAGPAGHCELDARYAQFGVWPGSVVTPSLLGTTRFLSTQPAIYLGFNVSIDYTCQADFECYGCETTRSYVSIGSSDDRGTVRLIFLKVATSEEVAVDFDIGSMLAESTFFRGCDPTPDATFDGELYHALVLLDGKELVQKLCASAGVQHDTQLQLVEIQVQSASDPLYMVFYLEPNRADNFFYQVFTVEASVTDPTWTVATY